MHWKLPNIILIVLDTARAKSFSCYGYHRLTTPNIDNIAENGILFERCFTPANWTPPSHASLFTGLYPSEHGCHFAGNPFLSSAILTLPEILREIGYHTCGITCNGLISSFFGYDRGFDTFCEIFQFFSARKIRFSGRSKKEKAFELLQMILKQESGLDTVGEFLLHWFYRKTLGAVIDNATPYTKRALKLARRFFSLQIDRPRFLFLNLMQAHCYYNPPRKVRGVWSSHSLSKKQINFDRMNYYAFNVDPATIQWDELVNLYDEELLFLDSEVGKFFVWLRENRHLENTVVVLTADHGELIGEHNLVDHICGLYNEVLWIPLILYYPSFGSGKVLSWPVQLHDLFATILSITEAPFPVPRYSYSLLEKNNREWVMAQDLDAQTDVERFRTRNANYEAKGFRWAVPGAALIDCKTSIKHIALANGFSETFNLKRDFWELDPLEKQSEAYGIRQLFNDVSIITGYINAQRQLKEQNIFALLESAHINH